MYLVIEFQKNKQLHISGRGHLASHSGRTDCRTHCGRRIEQGRAAPGSQRVIASPANPS
jgi:hypothetical protein